MKKLLMLILIAVLGNGIAQAADVVLSWQNPTENADGTTYDDKGAVLVYQRTIDTDFDFTSPIATLGPSEVAYTVTGLTEGHYVFVVRAEDTAGNKSYASNEAGKEIRIYPGPAQNLQVQ